jgi:uncharacterized membrane protein
MSLLFTSVAIGFVATGLVWADTTFMNKEELPKSSILKVFLLGFICSYLAGTILQSEDSSNMVTTTIENLSDSLKIGKPSF